MSRFVEVRLALGSLAEVVHALRTLGLNVEQADEPLALRGGLECGDAPVAVRVAAGACQSVEDFGFVADAHGNAVLVCGEPDRTRLERTLVVPLIAEVTRARLGLDPSLQIESEARADGAIRLRIRPR